LGVARWGLCVGGCELGVASWGLRVGGCGLCVGGYAVGGLFGVGDAPRASGLRKTRTARPVSAVANRIGHIRRSSRTESHIPEPTPTTPKRTDRRRDASHDTRLRPRHERLRPIPLIPRHRIEKNPHRPPCLGGGHSHGPQANSRPSRRTIPPRRDRLRPVLLRISIAAPSTDGAAAPPSRPDC
jgi:hypothetical protein